MSLILLETRSQWLEIILCHMQGIVIFGVTVYLQTLVIRKKGPVFVTAFRPLCTLVVAIMALPILGEALHLGRCVNLCMLKS